MQEREAVEQLLCGDINGLEFLVRRHQVRAVRAAYLITHDLPLAQDVVQAAFIKAYERMDQFDPRRRERDRALSMPRSRARRARYLQRTDRQRRLAGSADMGRPQRLYWRLERLERELDSQEPKRDAAKIADALLKASGVVEQSPSGEDGRVQSKIRRPKKAKGGTGKRTQPSTVDRPRNPRHPDVHPAGRQGIGERGAGTRAPEAGNTRHGGDDQGKQVRSQVPPRHLGGGSPTGTAKQKQLLVSYFNEYHALLVALGKMICTKHDPQCGECPLEDLCPKLGLEKA